MADTAKKGRGLGKLKYYCDACKRQCGDALGYQRHCESEAHLKMMEHFRENSAEILEQNSRQFESDFLHLLQRRGTQQVEANAIYQEFISNRDHIHMNVTKWATLSDFARYLGQTDKCLVEFIEGRGYYLTYVEKDLKKIEAQRRAKAVREVLTDQSSRLEEMVRDQVEQQKQQRQLQLQLGLSSIPHNHKRVEPLDGTSGEYHTQQEKIQPPNSISLSIAKGGGIKRKVPSIFDLDDESSGDQGESDGYNDPMDGNHNHITKGALTGTDNHPHPTHHNHHNRKFARHNDTTLSSSDHTMTNLTTSTPPLTAQEPQKRASEQKSDPPHPSPVSAVSHELFNSPTRQWCRGCSTQVEFPDDPPWMRVGLQVKILERDLKDGIYYGRRGVIKTLYAYVDDQILPYHPSPSVYNSLVVPSGIGQPSDGDKPHADDRKRSVCKEFNHRYPISIDYDKQECYDYRLISVADVEVSIPLPPDLNTTGEAISTRGEGSTITRVIRLSQDDMESTIPRSSSTTSTPTTIWIISGRYSIESLYQSIPGFLSDSSLSSKRSYDTPPCVKFIARTSDHIEVALIDEIYHEYDEYLQQHPSHKPISSRLSPPLYKKHVKVGFDDICIHISQST